LTAYGFRQLDGQAWDIVVEIEKEEKLTEHEAQQRKEFRRKLDELRTIIEDGTAYFIASQSLTLDEDTVAALNRYRGFFKPARNALLWMALMELAKVFDRDPRTVSLRNLLIEAKANRLVLTPYIDEQDLEHIQTQVDANEAVIKSLKRFRGKRLAHHDASVTEAKGMTLTYGKVEQLLEEVKGLYNVLERGHDGTHTAFDWLADDVEKDTSEVVRIMREERDRANQRFGEI